LPDAVARRLIREAESLESNPRPPGSIKLRGEDDLYRVRVGDWRIIYRIEEDRLTVPVVRVGHRRDIYRKGK
jgi:mRNA interferase RelE/StbE